MDLMSMRMSSVIVRRSGCCDTRIGERDCTTPAQAFRISEQNRAADDPRDQVSLNTGYGSRKRSIVSGTRFGRARGWLGAGFLFGTLRTQPLPSLVSADEPFRCHERFYEADFWQMGLDAVS
jgi:hypothetical protein